MATRLNRLLGSTQGNRDLGMPTSYWRSNENYIHNFLHNNRNSCVVWKLAISYPPDLYLGDTNGTRPTPCCQQFNCNTDQNNDASLNYASSEICFQNSNDQGSYQEQPPTKPQIWPVI